MPKYICASSDLLWSYIFNWFSTMHRCVCLQILQLYAWKCVCCFTLSSCMRGDVRLCVSSDSQVLTVAVCVSSDLLIVSRQMSVPLHSAFVSMQTRVSSHSPLLVVQMCVSFYHRVNRCGHMCVVRFIDSRIADMCVFRFCICLRGDELGFHTRR